MTLAMAPGLLQRGLGGTTRGWLGRLDRVPGWDYVVALDQLVRNGEAHGWLASGELFVLGTGNQQSSLEGIRGEIVAADCTVNGTIVFTRKYGASRADVSENSYIDLGLTVSAIDGVTLNSHSLAVYLTTNYLGPYQEAGASGTAGAKSFMIRGGSGFRSGAWAGSDQVIFGDGTAWGYAGFTRTGANSVIARKHQVRTTSSIPAVSLPAVNMTLLSAEPGASNSPNQLLLCHVGAGLTQEEGDWRERDFTQFVRTLGILDEIVVPPIVLGPNCFGPTAINDIEPNTVRVYRQTPFPATNSTPATSTNAYPITDAITRTYRFRGAVDTLAADPITTTNGSATVTIAHVGHGAKVDDVVQLLGASAFHGLGTADLNRRHLITEVPDVNSYKVVMPATANASGAGGGAPITARYTLIDIQTSTFMPPRGGRFWHNFWVNRGERDEPDGPYTTSNFKGNDNYGPITRMTAQVSPEITNAVSCRPVFTTKRRGGGAMLAHCAHVLGMLDRDDVRLTTFQGVFRAEGWGYLDIAEAWDLDPAMVMTWQEAFMRADELFTIALAGYAVCYDLAILSSKKLVDLPGGYTASQYGVWGDDEPANNWTPAFRLELFAALDDICSAMGTKWGLYGHYLTGSQAINNGWSKEIGYQVLALPACETIGIVSPHAPPGGIAAFLDAQADTFTDGVAPIDYSKLLVSMTLGAGKNDINDAGPLSAGQPTLEECDECAAWMSLHGIIHRHVRRVGMLEGGEITRVPNQQLIHYLPYLGGTGPVSGLGEAGDWEAAVIENGGTVSGDRLGAIGTYWITPLVDAGIWEKLDVCLLLKGENDIQCLTDLRNRMLASRGAGGAAGSFVVDGYWQCDGVDDYIQHLWTPSADAEAMTGTDQMLAVDVVDETPATSVYALGTVTNSALGQALRLNPLNSTTIGGSGYRLQGQAGFDNRTFDSATAWATAGLFAIQKAPGNASTVWLDGALLGTLSPSTFSATLPVHPLVIGAIDSSGTITGFKAGKRRLVLAGQSLTAEEWAIVQAAKADLYAAIDGA